MAGEKTEAPTPKRRDEARRKGQVARSADLNGAVVTLVGLAVLAATAPMVLDRMQDTMRDGLILVATPSVVGPEGLAALLKDLGIAAALAIAPVTLACMVAGVAVSAAQVRWKPSMKIVAPDPKRMNPLNGAKNLLGKHAAVETIKSVLKLAVIGAVLAATLLPKLEELGALVGEEPAVLLSHLAKEVLGVALRATAAYLVIALADYAWQRWSHEKSLKMTLEEVKQEHKGTQLPPEVRSAMRRRQMQNARARMMADVPQADVVVTNPTHYAVALRYTSEHPAPLVVAKGKDLLAARIRAIATEHGVPIVPDPPLARSLHASVDVGHMIPEELFHAVAQLLAFVYRTAGARRRAASGPMTTTDAAAA